MMDIVNKLTVGDSYVFNIRHPEQAGKTREILRVYCGHASPAQRREQTVVLRDSLGYYSQIRINDIARVLAYGA